MTADKESSKETAVPIYDSIHKNKFQSWKKSDRTSIRMIFKNLTGRIFQGQEYVEYIRHIAIGEMGFSPGIIEHCRDGEVIGKGKIPNV